LESCAVLTLNSTTFQLQDDAMHPRSSLPPTPELRCDEFLPYLNLCTSRTFIRFLLQLVFVVVVVVVVVVMSLFGRSSV
jgi:hypothetical protein